MGKKTLFLGSMTTHAEQSPAGQDNGEAHERQSQLKIRVVHGNRARNFVRHRVADTRPRIVGVIQQEYSRDHKHERDNEEEDEALPGPGREFQPHLTQARIAIFFLEGVILRRETHADAQHHEGDPDREDVVESARVPQVYPGWNLVSSKISKILARVR